MKQVNSFKIVGLDPVPVIVECQIDKGIGIHVIGLADATMKNSLLRTVTALQALGYNIPGKRIIINIAPADLYKSGSAYDLPIALSILAESGQEDLPDLFRYIIAGELGLDGSVRMISGAVPAATSLGMDMGLILPKRDAIQAAEATEGEVPVYGVESLTEAIEIVRGNTPGKTAWDEFVARKQTTKKTLAFDGIAKDANAVRVAELAAAGGHNTFIMGAPGSRKAVLAKTISELLPDMDKLETIENDKIYSVSDREIHHGQRPFRMPHYSSSITAMVGGGAGNIRPGEVTLANNGVLYLDEYAEMPKSLKEALRGPIEDKKVVISRLKSKIEYPADFLLVVGSMPCPCGYYGNEKKCMCAPGQRSAYLNRLSGPVFDRIDIQMYNRGIDDNRPAASFETTRERVAAARVIQEKRLGKKRTNAEMTREEIEKYCKLNAEGYELLMKLIERLGLSMRAYTRILKVARTIADLDGYEDIRPEHLSEAAGYRFLDRNIYHELLNNK